MTRAKGLSHHRPRLTPDDVVLGTLYTTAAITGRHRDQVARYCQPVACDVGSRLALYDVLAAHDTLKAIPRRVALTATA